MNTVVHDFRVDFQFGSDPHIYRGLGKSELCMVFLVHPIHPWAGNWCYGWVFRQEIPVHGGRSVTPGCQKCRFCRFFSKIWQNRVQKPRVLGHNWSKLAKTPQNGQFSLKWSVLSGLARFGHKRPVLTRFLPEMTKKQQKSSKNRPFSPFTPWFLDGF